MGVEASLTDMPKPLARLRRIGGREETERGFAPLHAPCVIPAEAGIQEAFRDLSKRSAPLTNVNPSL